ncbi:unnamed protein product, partial [Meganyctiphanes norvegica]
GKLSYSKCIANMSSTSQSTFASQFTDIIDNFVYMSIIFSLTSVCYSIVKWVALQMKRNILWRLGYVVMTFIAVGSRVYLKSTFGTYWDLENWFFINVYWLIPLIACNIASMIYSFCAPGPKFSLDVHVKRSLCGTCDFLSADG